VLTPAAAAAAAVLMLCQAEVGLLMAAGMTKKAGGIAVEALAQVWVCVWGGGGGRSSMESVG
jgi:hypothetical protein